MLTAGAGAAAFAFFWVIVSMIQKATTENNPLTGATFQPGRGAQKPETPRSANRKQPAAAETDSPLPEGRRQPISPARF